MLATLLTELPAQVFCCNVCEFLRTPFLQSTSRCSIRITKTASVIQKYTIFTGTEEQLFYATAFLKRPSNFIEHCFRKTCNAATGGVL